MTKAAIALSEQLKKAANVYLLKQLSQIVTQCMMELGVEDLYGTGYDLKTLQRTNTG